jgi:MoxR-like ATPase
MECRYQERFETVVDRISTVVLGKQPQIRLALTCLFAGGHLLIEDIPGIGKTTLASSLARVLGLGFRRVQFTSDLLPGDVLGVSVFEQKTAAFVFHPGPVFTQVLLADEINRATPKTQSALLEAMEERQVTVEGQTRPLPRPFFVIATQNPIEQSGTFPLPDSQMDRFLIRVDLGYPDRASERFLLELGETKSHLMRLETLLEPEEIGAVQAAAARVHAAPALVEYVLNLLEFTRNSPEFQVGLSPRAGLALLAAARTWAFLCGRDHALPEDVQAVLPYVVSHRLRKAKDFRELTADEAASLLARVPLP